jgi:predicted ATP-grasp superfamily ATP-dependent carboligase
MLVAWPGAAEVGLMAVKYIQDIFKMEPFASIDMKPFYVPEALMVKQGKLQAPQLPESTFYYNLKPDLILFKSNLQLDGKEGLFILHTILQIAKHFNVSRIYTFSALPRHVSHNTRPVIYSASNDDSLIEELKTFGIDPVEEGYVTGPAGLLPGLASTQNIESTCLLATIPVYVGVTWYPKATLQLVKTIMNLQNFTVDLGDLEKSVEEAEVFYKSVENQVLRQYPQIIKEEESLLLEDHTAEIEEKEEIPGHIIVNIEELFKVAKNDKAKAKELKEELDKWNLFDKYEKRFLNMFISFS